MYTILTVKKLICWHYGKKDKNYLISNAYDVREEIFKNQSIYKLLYSYMECDKKQREEQSTVRI